MAPPLPRRAIATRVPSARRSRSSAAAVFGSLRAAARAAARRAQERHAPLHLAHREALARGLAAERQLVLGPLEREQRARVAGVEPALRQELAQLARQPQQPHRVRDRGAVAADPARDLLLA